MFTINTFTGWFKKLVEGYKRSQPDYEVPGHKHPAASLSVYERRQKPGESYEDYCKRVPISYQPVEATDKNYLGQRK